MDAVFARPADQGESSSRKASPKATHSLSPSNLAPIVLRPWSMRGRMMLRAPILARHLLNGAAEEELSGVLLVVEGGRQKLPVSLRARRRYTGWRACQKAG